MLKIMNVPDERKNEKFRGVVKRRFLESWVGAGEREAGNL